MSSVEAATRPDREKRTRRREESDLVARVCRGETRLFAELVCRHQDSVFALAFRLLGNRGEAEDAAQEVFLRAYRSLAHFMGGSKLSTWLYRITFNLCADCLRKRSRSGRAAAVLDDPNELADGRTDPEGQALDAEERRAVRRAVKCLAGIYREVIILVYFQGLSLEDAAAVLEIPPKTVETRVYRARKLLRDDLASLTAAPLFEARESRD
jgi:RNA polymerase sigma factor (sigma-70 family)